MRPHGGAGKVGQFAVGGVVRGLHWDKVISCITSYRSKTSVLLH